MQVVKKHESTAIRRSQIVNAARKLIIKHGSEHLTVKRIAGEVGISEGTIYRHFKSKKDILFLLADHVRDNLVGDIAEARTRSPSSLEVLDGILRKHLSAIEERRGISFQIIAEIVSLGDKKLNRKIADTINEYVGRLRAILSDGVERGEIRGDIDPEAAAILLFGMVQGLVSVWALKNYGFDPITTYERLWPIFREGVLNTEHAPVRGHLRARTVVPSSR